MGKKKDGEFEKALKRLNEIVQELEEGEHGLDEMVELFAEGTKLRILCQKKLDVARGKIEKITTGANGKIEKVPFDADDARQAADAGQTATDENLDEE